MEDLWNNPLKYFNNDADEEDFFWEDNDDEDVLDNQIPSFCNDVFEGAPHQSSTPPSIEFSFKEFEDPLQKSSSLPLYDEPVYDVYDDDMFFEVLDVDKPMYDNVQNKMDAPLEFCMHIVPVKVINALAITDKGNALQNTYVVITNFRIVSIMHSCEELVNRMINHLSQELDAFMKKRWDMVLVNQDLGEVNEAKKNILFCDVCWQMETIVNRIFDCSRCKIDIGWKYPDRFSQPKSPPYDRQPDIL
ncbi:hypothetical protein IEQ34_015509 [Dendrobium chrysotoxum]|uniref:Transposase n=1 Tax=Dendrobium chrysotoxum TaxID=161865 RepID=A0AAV7GIZ3_DENCH|nr:hypothetical protein IEQ34_015509 [Dendrobium chrysotoxum]